MKTKGFSFGHYLEDVRRRGLDSVWNDLLKQIEKGEGPSIEDVGELYEAGLAETNKTDKKECGKYYTPDDVAALMGKYLLELNGKNLADVCCGTGKLILAYLKLLGREEARKLISEGRLYLYDADGTALKICRSVIGAIYGRDVTEMIHCIVGDFLNKDAALPNDCKVISNPPYARIKTIDERWEATEVVKDSMELYSAFMEKIIKNSRSSVIITPYSFIGGDKFGSLRKMMDDSNGFIVSFDNIPGCIFCGRKHGVFNSNKVNSVRAAITVTENNADENGYRCSGLIRFKQEERERLLKPSALSDFIGAERQRAERKYAKCFPELEPVLKEWKTCGTTLGNLLDENGRYSLCVPNSGRYYTTAARKDLERAGKHLLRFSDRETALLSYAFLNSSFSYWYWRLYDGGITYSLSLLKSLPTFFERLSREDKERILTIAESMMSEENRFLTYKKNAGKMQENIRFPDHYRKNLNRVFLNALVPRATESIFDRVHANKAFE